MSHDNKCEITTYVFISILLTAFLTSFYYTDRINGFRETRSSAYDEVVRLTNRVNQLEERNENLEALCSDAIQDLDTALDYVKVIGSLRDRDQNLETGLYENAVIYNVKGSNSYFVNCTIYNSKLSYSVFVNCTNVNSIILGGIWK